MSNRLMLKCLNKLACNDWSVDDKRKNWNALCRNLPNVNSEDFKTYVFEHCSMREKYVDRGQRNVGDATPWEDYRLRMDREQIWLLYYIVGGENMMV